MRWTRRRWTHALLALGSTAGWLRGAVAQAYPSRPIHLLVGYSAGGAVDVIARAVGQQIGAALGQTVLVENRPGAGTNIAMRALVDSAPDGYTLMLVANAIAANPALYHPAPLNPLRDVTPVSLVGRVPVVIVANAQGEITSLARLIALSKARPGSINVGTPGNGSTPHLAVALFQHVAGIEMTHVPYKGGAPAISDLLAGHIEAVAVNALEVQAHVKAGKLRVLAVMSPNRTPIFPDAPTVAESGFPGFEASVWYGFVGPAGLPPAVVDRLHAEIQKALAADAVRERLVAAGGEVLPGPVSRFAELLASETTRYARLIHDAHIQPD